MSVLLEPQLPEQYEVVDGEVIERACPSAYASEVANRIADVLATDADRTHFGRARLAMLYRIPIPGDANRQRFPSVTFTTFDRWPEGRPMPYRGNPVDVVPDLIVEVASPTDDGEDLVAKAHEYLEAGARLVWLVYPRSRVVYAYTSPTTVRVFTVADELVAEPVLPGFHVPMAQLFPEVIPEPEPPESENGAA
jgi:Uma2 family endonuclease